MSRLEEEKPAVKLIRVICGVAIGLFACNKIELVWMGYTDLKFINQLKVTCETILITLE